MLLTEQMKFLLFQVLSDSLAIAGPPFLLDRKSRIDLFEKIMKLQELNTEIKEEKKDG